MRRPSTRMSSREGSAFVPRARSASPFTVTRPSSINCSLARREATPAWERIFWRRSTTSNFYHGGRGGRGGSILTIHRQTRNVLEQSRRLGVKPIGFFPPVLRVLRGEIFGSEDALPGQYIAPEPGQPHHIPGLD